MEALSETSVSSYELKTLLACIAASRWFIGEIPSILETSEDTSRILSRFVGELTPHTTPGVADVLAARVRKLSIPGTTELLRLSLRKAELHESDELLSVVEDSSRILLGERPPGDFNDRCAKLRTLCAGLVARAVDYDGPISGWHKAVPYFFYREDTTWRPATDDPTPARFTARVTVAPAVTPAELWPVFVRPTIAPDSLLSLVDQFAKSLGSRANDDVRARLLPLPGVQSDEQLFDFTLESLSHPGANTIIFSIRTSSTGDKLEVINWEESVAPIETEGTLLKFLQTVAEAASTRTAVERLLLLSDRYDD